MSRRTSFEHHCSRCGAEWLSRSEVSPCNNCLMTDLFAQLPPVAITEADHRIIIHKPLEAIKIYKSAIEIGLSDARDLFEGRHTYLQKHFPEKFGKR